jgi:hypothetical protein
MDDIDIKITEEDLSAIISQKSSQITNMEVRIAALVRTIRGQNQKILELEDDNAKGRKEEIPVHD